MRVRAWLLALLLPLLLTAPGSAQAAVLIEARIAGAPVSLVADRHLDRVLLVAGSNRALFDLAAGLVYASAGGTAQRVHARYLPGHHKPPPYRIERFGPGPVLAGYGTDYHVLFVGEQVCAELMASGWMKPFVEPAIRALALLDRLDPPAEADPCEDIPFATYAAAGWPIMAGKIDHPTIETTRIAFDYQPQPDELTPPARFEQGDLQDLREVAKAAGL